MRIVRNLDTETWRKFVHEHPNGNIFHTPEMFQVFSYTKGYQPELWAIIDNNSQIRALLLPVRITLMGGVLQWFTSRAVAYGSVLCEPGPEGEAALTELLSAYNQQVKRNVLFTELRNLSDLNGLQPVLVEAGFVHEEHLNFLIDLSQTQETLWHRINKSSRQSVRTSRNKGTIVEEVTERHKVAIAHQLLQQVYSRVKVPLASLNLFETAFDILGPRQKFKIFMARVDEQFIGACLLLVYKGKIIYWYAGSDRAFSAYTPAELLLWHVWQWGQAHGCHLFDFGGAGKPNEDYGPRRFKAKFGGTLVNYGRNVYVHAPMRLKFTRVGYQLFRKF